MTALGSNPAVRGGADKAPAKWAKTKSFGAVLLVHWLAASH
jgi:hypothetical protein